MLQLILLLSGANFVRKYSIALVFMGLAWGGVGVSIFIDGLNGMRFFPLHFFGGLLLIDSLITLILAPSGIGAQKSILYFKGIIFLTVSFLIMFGQHKGNLILAIILGFSFFIMGLFIIATALVVRYSNWKGSLLYGIGQILFAIFLFLPYPTNHEGTVSQFLGAFMMLGAFKCLILAWKAYNLTEGVAVFNLLAPGGMFTSSLVIDDYNSINDVSSQELIIHVWTPEGSAAGQTIARPLINRYIAAVDVNGVISTGHAALELKNEIYISLYPAVDIDRSPSEFFNTLKAVKENNVPGQFQESYDKESASWCESDRKVCFSTYNPVGLRRYWNQYSKTAIYNLTWRNCSSSVAYGLEAALDGVFAKYGLLNALHLFFIPELWIAAQIRRRATTMAWTPGLVLDYARALQTVVQPTKPSLIRRLFLKNKGVK